MFMSVDLILTIEIPFFYKEHCKTEKEPRKAEKKTAKADENRNTQSVQMELFG